MEDTLDNILTKALKNNKIDNLLNIFTMKDSELNALQYKDDQNKIVPPPWI